jgi:hypothetical protein
VKKISIIVLALSLFFLGLRSTDAYELVLNNTPVQVYFSPNGGAAAAIIKEINGARTEILMQAYSFTIAAFFTRADAPCRAHQKKRRTPFGARLRCFVCCILKSRLGILYGPTPQDSRKSLVDDS